MPWRANELRALPVAADPAACNNPHGGP